MRIAFFSHSAGLNGAERSLLDIVLGIRDFDVYSLVILPHNGPLVDELEKNNIDYIIYPYVGWIGKRFRIVKGVCGYLLNYGLLIGLKRKLQKMHVELVYSNTLAIPVGALLAKKLGLKHVWHIREFIQEDLDLEFNFGIYYATQFVAKNSNYIIYNSSAIKEKFTSLIADVPSCIIYNGWLIKPLFYQKKAKELLSTKSIRLCIVGSISLGKGQHEAIHALSILKAKFINISLVIIGTGDKTYIDELKVLCSKLRVSSQVVWFGFSNDVSGLFRQSDIALVCSRSEAFGRVVVEAMSEGCPVIGARSGGIPEIIRDGDNGLMYESENIDDLVRQISRLIIDTNLYSKISEIALTDVYARFSRERYAEQIYHVLCELKSN